MKRLYRLLTLTLFIIFILNFPVAAQEKNPLDGFEEFVLDVMKDWTVPGLAISIVKDGKLLYAEGFGFRDIEKGLEVTPDTLFAIGSCTKAFTATAMGILVDLGKLDWDKPVKEYIPRFKLDDPFASERMTPRDLVCHRSGLPRHDFVWYGSSATREELVERLQHLQPSQDFRTLFQYQNLMFMTAGYLTGQISQMPWEDFIQKHILDPLDMKNSNFSVETSKKAPDFALPYSAEDKKTKNIPFRNIDTVGPAGSINSSVREMANWLMLNLNKGKFGDKQIVSENNLKEVHSPQMIASNAISNPELFYSLYGMGWMITAYRGQLLLTHGGGIDGFTASVTFMPNKKIGLCILTNLGGNPTPTIVGYNVYDRLLGMDEVSWNERMKKQREQAEKAAEKRDKEKDTDRKLNTSPSHSLEDYAGKFEHPGYGIFTVTKEGERLEAKYNSSEWVLTHYHYDTFEASSESDDSGTKISYFSDEKGNIVSLSISMESAVDDIIFTRQADESMRDKEFLSQFIGEYVFDNMTALVAFKDDQTLTMTVPNQPIYELVPYKGTEFNLKNLSGFSVEFIFDESGKVIEMKSKQPNGVFTAKKK